MSFLFTDVAEIKVTIDNSMALTVHWKYLHHIDKPEDYNIHMSIDRHPVNPQPLPVEPNSKQLRQLKPDTNYKIGLKICNRIKCTQEKFYQVQTPCNGNYHFGYIIL